MHGDAMYDRWVVGVPREPAIWWLVGGCFWWVIRAIINAVNNIPY